jgi:hypothetical protein
LAITWDQAAGKGDVYPCVWFEMPVLVEYSSQNKFSKQFSFSIDILDLPKLDDLSSEIDRISYCEQLADEILYQLFKDKDCEKSYTLVNLPNGLTVKNINADGACGIRVDLKINTGRECLGVQCN